MGNEEAFIKEFEMIRNFEGPILGICLGFEIIVRAFGGGRLEVYARKGKRDYRYGSREPRQSF